LYKIKIEYWVIDSDKYVDVINYTFKINAMTHGKTDLPVYIYVAKIGNGKYFHFKGDFLKGRKPTNKEYKIFEKIRIPYIESQLFIAGLRNPLYSAENIRKETKHNGEFCFPTLESLISSAIDVYSNEGYTSGLILGYDGKKPLPDRVLIVGDGGYNTEEEFLRAAQNNTMWV